ncbi:MAG: nitroreductase family protein [Clostridiales bacterium]|nr:nitroreductase family protein [Clostridiales bacterium]
MNETLELIKSRRSVKKYKDTPVEKELIEKIVEAGTWAPTGRNRQAPIILAITDKETIATLSKVNAEIMGAEGTDPFYGAPCVLVVLADKNASTYLYDGSLVMGNLMLASHALGLGSCWIHRAKQTFEREEGKAILTKLGIEGDYEGIGNCVIGYADIQPQAKDRKENWVYYVD